VLVPVSSIRWGQDVDKWRSRAAGIDHHLTKPTDIDTMKRLFDAKS
jgi:hypothetical protein